MKEKKKDFIMLLEDLCDIYCEYANRNNWQIDVYIDKNIINILLHNNVEIMDKFGLAFRVDEKDKYQYISMALMKIFFGSSIIYNKGKVIYNEEDKPYVKMYVEDNDMLIRMINTFSFFRDIDYLDRIGSGVRARNKINRTRSINNMKDRVEITKPILKKREKQ